MAASKGAYHIHYSLDTTEVLHLSGCIHVKAKDADHARAKGIRKISRLLADITEIRIHEVHKARVHGYEPEEVSA